MMPIVFLPQMQYSAVLSLINYQQGVSGSKKQHRASKFRLNSSELHSCFNIDYSLVTAQEHVF